MSDLKSKSKSKSKGRDKNKPVYSRPAKALARDCASLYSLLWQKALANSSPEVREMLLTVVQLEAIDASVFPEDQDSPRHWSFDAILGEIQKAEAILIGGHEAETRDCDAK